MSSLQLLEPQVLARGISRLRDDLRAGTWARGNRAMLLREVLDMGWRLVFNPDREGLSPLDPM